MSSFYTSKRLCVNIKMRFEVHFFFSYLHSRHQQLVIDFHCFLAMAVSHPFLITARTLIIKTLTPYLQLYDANFFDFDASKIFLRLFHHDFFVIFFGLKIFHLNARLDVFGSEKVHYRRMRMMVHDDNLMTGQHG